jgi:hypothetical protein
MNDSLKSESKTINTVEKKQTASNEHIKPIVNLSDSKKDALLQETKSSRDSTPARVSGTGDLIQLNLEPIERIPDSDLLKIQNNSCASCKGRIYSNFLINFFRYCSYTGKLYCMECHLNDYSIIPAFVLHYLDSREYPVCSNAKIYLDTMVNVPVLSIAFFPLEQVANNPLFSKLRTLRKQFSKMKDYIYSCKKKDKMLQILGTKSYLLEDDDAFTLKDYTLCISENSGAFLFKVFNVLDLHIRVDCSQCKQKGFICEYCKDSNLIYPHQISSVITCRRCSNVYHLQCYDKTSCPKCQRMNLRQYSKMLK